MNDNCKTVHIAGHSPIRAGRTILRFATQTVHFVTVQYCNFPVLLLSSFVNVQNCYFPVLIFSSCDAFLLSSLDQFPPFHASALQSTDCSRCEGGSRINQSFEERVRVEKFSHVPPAQRVRWTWLALAPIRVILMDASGRSERNYHTKRAISPTVAANLRHH